MYWSMSLAPLGLVNLVKAKSHSLELAVRLSHSAHANWIENANEHCMAQIRNRVFFVGVNRLSICAGWMCEASILLSCSHQQVRQSMV